jgi:hypothetical protein
MVHVAVVFDLASICLTDEARKVGDFMAGTYVVNSPPNRDLRVMDMYEMEELAILERRLRHLNAELESAGYLEPGEAAKRRK